MAKSTETPQQYIKNRIRETSNGCWLWQQATDNQGYGYAQVYWGRAHGKNKAHQLSYLAFNGLIPDGLMICHTCDNPSCCNPRHLTLGTAKDNMNQKIMRGRANSANGTQHGKAKLVEADVVVIRQEHKAGSSFAELGRKFNVAKTTIRDIIIGKTWCGIK